MPRARMALPRSGSRPGAKLLPYLLGFVLLTATLSGLSLGAAYLFRPSAAVHGSAAAGHAAAPLRGPSSRDVPGGFAGASPHGAPSAGLGLRGRAHERQPRDVRARFSMPDIDAYDFLSQFFIALIPAIILEFLLLPPGEALVRQFGFARDDTDRPYIEGGTSTILQQSPFTFDAWSKHRSNPSRYISTTVGLLGSSTVLKRLQGPLFFLNIVSATVLFYDTYFVPTGLPNLSLPALPFTISSSALGLLLVFRVTNANNRFVLARGIWGDILNVSRDLAQQASLWAPMHEDFMDFVRWTPAFSTSLMCHLRNPKTHDLAGELRKCAGPADGAQSEGRGITEEEISEIINRPAGYSAPHYVLHRLRDKIQNMGLAEQERLLMEANISRLINNMGACENVLATPIPVGYTKHTTRFLFLWLTLLPLALQGQLGVGTVFGEQLIAFGLLGIEDVGIQLEEPFSVLPIERIVTKVALESQVLRKKAKTDLSMDDFPAVVDQELVPAATAMLA